MAPYAAESRSNIPLILVTFGAAGLTMIGIYVYTHSLPPLELPGTTVMPGEIDITDPEAKAIEETIVRLFKNGPTVIPNTDLKTDIKPYPQPNSPKSTATISFLPQPTPNECQPQSNTKEILTKIATEQLKIMQGMKPEGLVGGNIDRINVDTGKHKVALLYPKSTVILSPVLGNDPTSRLRSALTTLTPVLGTETLAAKFINELIPQLGFVDAESYRKSLRQATIYSIDTTLNKLKTFNDFDTRRGAIVFPKHVGDPLASGKQGFDDVRAYAIGSGEWDIVPGSDVHEISAPKFNVDGKQHGVQSFSMRNRKTGLIIDVFSPYETRDLAVVNFNSYDHIQVTTDIVVSGREGASLLKGILYSLSQNSKDYKKCSTRSLGFNSAYATWGSWGYTMAYAISGTYGNNTIFELFGGGFDSHVDHRFQSLADITFTDKKLNTWWLDSIMGFSSPEANAGATYQWGGAISWMTNNDFWKFFVGKSNNPNSLFIDRTSPERSNYPPYPNSSFVGR